MDRLLCGRAGRLTAAVCLCVVFLGCSGAVLIAAHSGTPTWPLWVCLLVIGVLFYIAGVASRDQVTAVAVRWTVPALISGIPLLGLAMLAEMLHPQDQPRA